MGIRNVLFGVSFSCKQVWIADVANVSLSIRREELFRLFDAVKIRNELSLSSSAVLCWVHVSLVDGRN